MHPSIPESSQTEGQSPRSCLPVASAYTLRWKTRHCMSLIRACSHFSTKPGCTYSCAFLSAWGRSGVDTRLRGRKSMQSGGRQTWFGNHSSASPLSYPCQFLTCLHRCSKYMHGLTRVKQDHSRHGIAKPLMPTYANG